MIEKAENGTELLKVDLGLIGSVCSKVRDENELGKGSKVDLGLESNRDDLDPNE